MEPFKNQLSIHAARRILQAVQRVFPDFNVQRFELGLSDVLEPLELKARMLLIAGRLIAGLPESPKDSFPLLIGALKNGANDDVGLDGFEAWPLIEVVAMRGLGEERIQLP